MKPEFVGEEISVRCAGPLARPVEIIWSGRTYTVKAVLAFWYDSGFAPGSPRKRTWRLRHHRNYYHVKIDTGEIFEIYLDRADKRGPVWVLSQVIFRPPWSTPEAADSGQ